MKEPVMVMESYALGAIGAIRSLGSAGYQVHACSWQPRALGLHSRYAAATCVHPRYETPEFIPWLREYIEANSIRLIIPSEGFVLGVRNHIREFMPLLPLPDDSDTLFSGFGKYDLFKRIQDRATANPHLLENLPPFLLLEQDEALPSEQQLADLGLPLFIKADGCHGLDTVHGEVARADTAKQAIERIKVLRKRFKLLMVQGFAPGIGAGCYFLRWNGNILAQFSNRCLHEVPHTGGLSSLRESWHHPAMMEDARLKLEAMEWQGVAMMEYRWNPETGRFYLMEMNARFWAALHLAIFSGVNFPQLLADVFFDRAANDKQPEYAEGLMARWTVPLEIGYVRSLMKDPDVSTSRWLKAIAEYFVLMVHPRVRADWNYPGDRQLYIRAWWEFLRGVLFER
ncbi:ATP-grasp domain-containing protein [Parahaliea mediterranea]|uniref:ATP-grasp domain-containing protein n=1 Tax=Parahaliea mediterranea TaxID=651086 RepID=A0A939DHU0_9GAMM|nr:ATP-grasp domain-containing protein [Parahaliea mediterranea]MBN7798529.1 ATP-grasp domain-containing protein [Parahaliea mediterranea]